MGGRTASLDEWNSFLHSCLGDIHWTIHMGFPKSAQKHCPTHPLCLVGATWSFRQYGDHGNSRQTFAPALYRGLFHSFGSRAHQHIHSE